MSKSLVAALGEGAWSVSAVMFDLNDMVDDEGRPISERRADAAVRTGVEMEMRECPYGGIRHGRLMNVSALVQISHYFTPVMAEIAAFRRQAGGANATWDDILACVIDQLARPAIHLLQQHSVQGPVPAQMAVGHKLAAGFFGVMRGLHERLALGACLPVTVETFLNLVDEMGALVGASEACAGSPQMIRKASATLVEGGSDIEVELAPLRVEMARCLALQVQTGIFWDLYDRVHLWSLVRGEFREHLTPRNHFLAQRLESAQSDAGAETPPRPDGDRLPIALEGQLRDRLAGALRDAAAPAALAEDIRTATELLDAPGCALCYDGPPAALAWRVANYLNAHRLFSAALSGIERDLRKCLGFPADAPIRLGPAVFPTPQALQWYELVLGARLGADGHLTRKMTGARNAAPAAVHPAQGA
jgi:hypothetical protein